jgi:hypothetical protein
MSTLSSGSNARVLLRATLIGTVLQLALVFAGQSSPAVKQPMGLLGMLISLVAGWLYGRWQTWGGRAAAAVGGAVVGGLCALLGLLESLYLKDVPAWVLLVGPAGSAVTGAVGGAIPRPRRHW